MFQRILQRIDEKTGINGYVYNFFVGYNIIDTSDIINVHKYLMKTHDIKKCLVLLKQHLSDY